MSESGDFDPGDWKGHDFKSARAVFDAHAGRSYADARAAKKTNKDLVVDSLTAQCTNPLIIVSDVTGSMGEWPATMFSKLPYLELEGQEYLGKDMEIAWTAVGDAYHDQYPLQVRPFTSGTALKDRLQELVIEGEGGAQTMESYELMALFLARKVTMPNAVRPIVIFIGDESPYEFVDKQQAKDLGGIDLEGRLSTAQIFAELKTRFAVYLIRKPYGSNSSNTMDSINRRIYEDWVKLLGSDHICDLPEASRVVDVIFGILARETGRTEYFQQELVGRQKPAQVKTVMKSVGTIHNLPAPGSPVGHSRLLKPGDGPKTDPLV